MDRAAPRRPSAPPDHRAVPGAASDRDRGSFGLRAGPPRRRLRSRCLAAAQRPRRRRPAPPTRTGRGPSSPNPHTLNARTTRAELRADAPTKAPHSSAYRACFPRSGRAHTRATTLGGNPIRRTATAATPPAAAAGSSSPSAASALMQLAWPTSRAPCGNSGSVCWRAPAARGARPHGQPTREPGSTRALTCARSATGLRCRSAPRARS